MSPRFAVAPMMDRTDRHCRYFHRLLTRRSLLYSEMVTAEAVIHGDRGHLLGHDSSEHPLALQLGGSDPERLVEAARIGADYGYDEIDLNVGCPSDRVKSGHFGACLMREPDLVAACVAAVKDAVDVRVTVKCRLGVDDQDPEEALDRLADAVVAAGVDGIWVHARKAWLKGLNPKQNRNVPPLDYDRVYRLKQRLPNLFVGINGGIGDLDACRAHLGAVDGVMLGRVAYDQPAMLASVDRLIFGGEASDPDVDEVAMAMIAYAERYVAEGHPVGHVARHMLGLFHATAGARSWRRILTVGASRQGAGAEIIGEALEAVVLARRSATEADAAFLAA